MSEPKPKQYLFVSSRDVNVGSTHGYSIFFPKGVPTHVPRIMHSEVMEKGILPCDAKGNTLDAPAVAAMEPPALKIMVAPEDAEERTDQIRDALKALAAKGDSKDFTAGGIPSASATTAVLGWRVDAKEIRPVWAELKPEIVKSEGAGK
jgi:hypothetical protein